MVSSCGRSSRFSGVLLSCDVGCVVKRSLFFFYLRRARRTSVGQSFARIGIEHSAAVMAVSVPRFSRKDLWSAMTCTVHVASCESKKFCIPLRGRYACFNADY